MKKTTIGTFLNVLLAWTLVVSQRGRRDFYSAHEAGILNQSHLIRFFIPLIIALLIIFFLLRNAMKGKKFPSFRAFMKEDLVLTLEDERERTVSSEIALKNYQFLGNLLVVLLVLLPFFSDWRAISTEQILLFIALVITIDSAYYLWNFRKAMDA